MSNLTLYEDPLVTIRLSEKPVSIGHIEIVPKRKATTINDLSEQEIEHLFFGASYSASILFEKLGAHGTNIILNENNEQLTIHVIARKEGDGLDFSWTPHQASIP